MGPPRSRLQCSVKTPEIHHLNLSDHTYIEICISTAASYIQTPTMKGSRPEDLLRPRVKWTHCDLGRYKAAVRQDRQHSFPLVACTGLDADPAVRSISSTLRKASELSCSMQRKDSPRRGFLSGVMESLQLFRSKVGHLEWKRAGCSKNPGDPSFQERKVKI